jgi:hypothetical protein
MSRTLRDELKERFPSREALDTEAARRRHGAAFTIIDHVIQLGKKDPRWKGPDAIAALQSVINEYNI